ncbi:MAG TPA: VapC toxin family PIN domain ribonuclease [Lentisphaeria bacterium]|nr:MAG: twitching motility protein PilT [Lentisphaerae bacterium GWF2_50_93]HCE46806.1 VapC toxin family PIN domain ribonuclease [Lentisphaeria bacterium]
MKYMLDTNICIFIIRQRSLPVLHRIEKTPPGQIAISAITVAELQYGVFKSSNPEKNAMALSKFISPFNVLPLTEKDTMIYGKIRSDLERRGNCIGPFDLLIAAHAISNSLVLVTNNLKEFSRVGGLAAEDWHELKSSQK